MCVFVANLYIDLFMKLSSIKWFCWVALRCSLINFGLSEKCTAQNCKYRLYDTLRCCSLSSVEMVNGAQIYSKYNV